MDKLKWEKQNQETKTLGNNPEKVNLQKKKEHSPSWDKETVIECWALLFIFFRVTRDSLVCDEGRVKNLKKNILPSSVANLNTSVYPSHLQAYRNV